MEKLKHKIEPPSQFIQHNIIPLKFQGKEYNYKVANPNPKTPEDYSWKPYQTVAFPSGFLDDYKGNIGVILGDPFGENIYLTQIDIDDPKYFKYFREVPTCIVKSGKGYHVYVKSKKPVGTKKDYPIKGIELRGSEGSYAVIPPSIHPETREPYSIFKDENILVVEDATSWVKNLLNELKDQFKKEKTFQHTEKTPINIDNERILNHDQIDEIVSILRPYYIPDYRNDITYSLSGMLKKEGITHKSAQEIIKELSKNDQESQNRIKVLDRTYQELIPPEELKGISGIWDALETQGQTKEDIRIIKKELDKHIKAPKYHGKIFGSIGSNTNVIIDPVNKQILEEKTKIINDKDYSTENIIAEAYFKDLTVYESPLTEEPRRFETLIQSRLSKRNLKIGPCLIEDIVNILKESGYIINSRRAIDVITKAVNLYIEHNIANIKNEIEHPGFFYDLENKKIIAVKYDLKTIQKSRLNTALSTLELLGDYFEGHETKLATVFKWGLMAPFGFVKKQLGEWIPAMYLYGKAKSGKTTMGYIILHIWGMRDEDHDIAGSHFDTVARVGNKLSQSTFPLIVNEPAGAFEKISVVEIIKSAIERTVARAKFEGRSFRSIPAFANMLFTANQYIPNRSGADALIRRMEMHSFSHSEKKTEEQIKQFEDDFNITNIKKTRLNDLKIIGHFVANELILHPELVEEDWKTITNKLIERMYQFVGREIPGWVLDWSESESMEDIEDEHVEDIRGFILDKINNSYGRIQILDEDGRVVEDLNPEQLKVKKDFHGKVWLVLNERLVPWMVPYQPRNIDKKYVCLTIGFKKELQKYLQICEPLKSISELLGWKYQTVKLSTREKVIKVSLDKFVEFLYPSYVFEQENKEKEDL